MGHKFGRGGDESSPFQGQVVEEEVTKEIFWRSCELERKDENIIWQPHGYEKR
jgi:hypothetical protein